jgi:hypothetical protein
MAKTEKVASVVVKTNRTVQVLANDGDTARLQFQQSLRVISFWRQVDTNMGEEEFLEAFRVGRVFEYEGMTFEEVAKKWLDVIPCDSRTQ